MTGTDTICQFVDTIVDEYITTKKKIRVDFFKYLQSEDIDRKSINEYTNWSIEQLRHDYDPLTFQITEGFSDKGDSSASIIRT